MSDYDVIIVGGGIAGATAALALARNGRRCLLAEIGKQPGRKIGDTLRFSARPLLQTLGLWEEFTGAGHLESWGSSSAWGGSEPVERDFIFEPYGCSWNIDRLAFEIMILRAAEASGVEIRWQFPITFTRRHASKWEVSSVGNHGQAVRASWLVDATGRRAVIARSLGVRRQSIDRLVALYSVWDGGNGQDKDSRTLIESCQYGWWYSSLLPDGRRIVSLQTDLDLLAGESWQCREWFVKSLERTKNLSLLIERHRYRLFGLPQLTSAQSGKLQEVSADAWVAVGDAAMSFDPLAGLGMQNAMQSAIKAAELVCAGEKNVASFREQCSRDWNNYTENRKLYYALETQWSASPFWQRRQI